MRWGLPQCPPDDGVRPGAESIAETNSDDDTVLMLPGPRRLDGDEALPGRRLGIDNAASCAFSSLTRWGSS